MTILNGQPIDDPTPKPKVTATPAPTAARTTAPDPSNFIFSIMALIFSVSIPLVGAILGGIAMNQSRRAGYPNTIAKVAFIIGLVLTILIVVFTVVGIVFGIGLFSQLFQVCGQLGEGTHQYNGVTYSCN
jgi:hypothetical protein